jgi:hypothetical protein
MNPETINSVEGLMTRLGVRADIPDGTLNPVQSAVALKILFDCAIAMETKYSALADSLFVSINQLIEREMELENEVVRLRREVEARP